MSYLEGTSGYRSRRAQRAVSASDAALVNDKARQPNVVEQGERGAHAATMRGPS